MSDYIMMEVTKYGIDLREKWDYVQRARDICLNVYPDKTNIEDDKILWVEGTDWDFFNKIYRYVIYCENLS